ncbi:hypothetical protein ACLMJK_002875 [Lecanora helva]
MGVSGVAGRTVWELSYHTGIAPIDEQIVDGSLLLPPVEVWIKTSASINKCTDDFDSSGIDLEFIRGTKGSLLDPDDVRNPYGDFGASNRISPPTCFPAIWLAPGHEGRKSLPPNVVPSIRAEVPLNIGGEIEAPVANPF